MSEDSRPSPDEAALMRLEAAVEKLLERLGDESTRTEAERERGNAAEARAAELAELVRRFTGNEGEADRLMSRLKRLEEENADLRTRLERGRDGVDRMIARIRFLENQG